MLSLYSALLPIVPISRNICETVIFHFSEVVTICQDNGLKIVGNPTNLREAGMIRAQGWAFVDVKTGAGSSTTVDSGGNPVILSLFQGTPANTAYENCGMNKYGNIQFEKCGAAVSTPTFAVCQKS